MAKFDSELAAHKAWLGLLQPVGLVISPPALVKAQAVLDRNVVELQQALLATVRRPPRTRPLVRWDRLVKGGYLTPERKIAPVVPVRFVQACVRGHIIDLDWYAFVREDFRTDRIGQLWLDEGGAGNDFSEIFVRCERTGRRRPLAQAKVHRSRTLGTCSGRQPWLGPKVWEPCDQPNRLLIRSASDAYFSQTLRVIAIPDPDAAVRNAVDQVDEDFLQYAESLEDLKRERKKQKVFYALEGLSDKAAWAEVRRRKRGAAHQIKGIKEAEIETLLSSPDSLGEDAPDGDFYARARTLEALPPWLDRRLESASSSTKTGPSSVPPTSPRRPTKETSRRGCSSPTAGWRRRYGPSLRLWSSADYSGASPVCSEPPPGALAHGSAVRKVNPLVALENPCFTG